MPKVSIVVPTYNVEKYLPQCLDSITGQTLKDIEIVCVNDGSTDHSLDIIEKYAKKDPRIVIVTGANGGYGKAMNRGIDIASGEYIGIVEPDDFVDRKMYEDLYETAAKYRLDFVKSDFYRFQTEKETGEIKHTLFRLSPCFFHYYKVFDPSQNPGTLRFRMNTWNGIYRREFLINHGIRHHETPGASYQDNGFHLQTFAFGRRAMIVHKAYYWNRRDNVNSSVCDKGKVDAIHVEYDWIEALLKKNPDLWERFKYDYWRQRYLNYYKTICRISPELRTDYLIRIRKDLWEAKRKRLLKWRAFPLAPWSEVQLILYRPEAFLKYDHLADTEAKRTAKLKPVSHMGFFLKYPYYVSILRARTAKQQVREKIHRTARILKNLLPVKRRDR